MSSPDSPPRIASQHPLPYELATARAVAASPGGWTGFWIVTWAAVVGLIAVLLAAALVLGDAMLDVVELGIAQLALEQKLPPQALEEPAAKLTDAAALLVGHVQVWVWIVALLSVVLMVTALRLTTGSERGRKSSRLLLALLTGVLVAGSAHVWLTAVPALASHADALRAAIMELARSSGTPVDSARLERMLDPALLSLVAWAPALLLGTPSGMLWLAAGRRSLRAWCSPPSTPSTG